MTPLFGNYNEYYYWIIYIQNLISSLQSEFQTLIAQQLASSAKQYAHNYKLIYFEDTADGLNTIFNEASGGAYSDISSTNIFNQTNWNTDISGRIIVALNHNNLNTNTPLSISSTNNFGLIEQPSSDITFSLTQSMINKIEIINHNLPYNNYTNSQYANGLHILSLINQNDMSNSSFSSAAQINLNVYSGYPLTDLLNEMEFGTSSMFGIYAYSWWHGYRKHKDIHEITHLIHKHISADINTVKAEAGGILSIDLQALEVYVNNKITVYESTLTNDIITDLNDMANRIYDTIHSKIKSWIAKIKAKKTEI